FLDPGNGATQWGQRRSSVKKIVVIGTGRMGGAFATAFVKRTSHAVSIRGSHAGSSSAAALSRQLGVRVVVYLQSAGKYKRPARRPSKEQKGIDERAIMASQSPSHP